MVYSQKFWEMNEILTIRQDFYLCLIGNELFKPKLKIVAYDNNEKRMDSVYSKRLRAGKRRTYFFDVRTTRGNDYYLTITESRKRFNDNGYDRHKIFLYKEDFNKFIKALNEAVDHVKTELMPDFDFDAFNHENDQDFEGDGGDLESRDDSNINSSVTSGEEATPPTQVQIPAPETNTHDNGSSEEVDKW
jgi:hypothetical protein